MGTCANVPPLLILPFFWLSKGVSVGVLDDLKKEAQAAAAEQARETTARAKALAEAREQIAPRMRKAFKYFEELKQHLELVNREIRATYGVRGIGRVDGLLQGKYSVTASDPQSLEKFSFRCVCAKSGVFQVNQADPASAAAYKAYLRDNRLQAKVRDAGKGAATFMVQPVVPVVVEFSSDYERVGIGLRVRNLNEIGVERHSLDVEQLDEKLLDEVAKAILRTDNRFDELVGNVISQSGQIRLKRKIRAAMRQKELEAELEEQRIKKEQGISQILSRRLFGRKDDA